MPYALYRLYGEEETLLYVGMSMNLPARMTQHKVQKVWWQSVRHITVDHFDSRRAVLDAEREAIQSERPLWNIQHSVGASDRPRLPSEEAIGTLFGLVPEMEDADRRRELAQAFDEATAEDQNPDGSAIDYSRWPVELKAVVQAVGEVVEREWCSSNTVHRALKAITSGDPSAALADARVTFSIHGDPDPSEGELERFALLQAIGRLVGPEGML